MAITNPIQFNHLQGNIFGSVTATVASLPLALDFGVASGVKPPSVDSMEQFVSAFLPPYLAVSQRWLSEPIGVNDCKPGLQVLVQHLCCRGEAPHSYSL
jgi:hypothetical protein